MTPPLCVFGFAETALVNQAPAKSAPGLGPSGFDPHAFARPGLRAPLGAINRKSLIETEPQFTTQTALQREKRIHSIERDGRGAMQPVMSGDIAKSSWKAPI